MLKNKEQIEEWLDNYYIENYTINDDLTVNVDGYVDLSNIKLSEGIAVQFNIVSGNFNVSRSHLMSLVGCPQHVGGNFDCNQNQLTSLKGCPNHVGKIFNCYGNQLKSLEFSPQYVGEDFHCANNLLTDLKFSPIEILGDFICYNNPIENIDNFSCKFTGLFAHCNSIIPQLQSFYESTEQGEPKIIITHSTLQNILLNKKLHENIEIKKDKSQKLKL